MTDKPMYTICGECGAKPSNQSDYCPSCGTEDPWEQHYEYDMGNVEFPVIVEREEYNDHYGLWDDFCREVFGERVKGGQVANMPSTLPRMKYCVFTTYWKITKHEAKGPFLSRQAAEDA